MLLQKFYNVLRGILRLADNMMLIWCARDRIFAKFAGLLTGFTDTSNSRLSSLNLSDLADAVFTIGTTIPSLRQTMLQFTLQNRN